MTRRNSLLALLVAGAIGVAASSPAASQFVTTTKVNNLTFSHPVALPGVALGPGTYVFEAGPQVTNSSLVRVLSRNRQIVYYTGFTIPVSRPRGTEGSTVVLGEAARGAATPILAWYPIGSTAGHEFMYR